MSKVSSISIVGYKSIKTLEDFSLGDLNVLVGPNGAGKSNFVSVFELLNKIAEEKLQTYIQTSGGAHTLLYYGPKNTQNIELKFNFGPNSYSCKLTANDKDSFFFEEEFCGFLGKNPQTGKLYERPYTKSILTSDRKESGLLKASSNVAKYVINSIKSWRIYHFHDTSQNSGMKKLGKIDDNQKLRDDASNLAAYLYLLKNRYQQEYNNIVRTIRLVAPFFGDFILRPSPFNPDFIKLEWSHKTSDEYFDASSLSDGSLRFICLATLLLQPTDNLPTTILLDEPELGLHPHAITILAKILKNVSKNRQIIVSTQSTTLINQLNPEDLIVIDRDQEQTTFRRLAKDETERWLDDFGLGDLWEKNIFGGTP